MSSNETEFEHIYKRYSHLTSPEILQEFNTSISGITEGEANKRLQSYGKNALTKSKEESKIIIFLKKFTNPLILILIIIVLASIFFGEKISAIVIMITIFVSVCIDFLQETKSNQAIEKLNELIRTKVSVFRSNNLKEIDITEVVPGDIIELSAGNIIPADIRIISSKDIFVNQASLTGESFPVEKFSTNDTQIEKIQNILELKNIAFLGSSIVSGNGLGVAIRTGNQTEFGEISKHLHKTHVQTSFDKGLVDFTKLMIKATFILAVMIFFIIWSVKNGSLSEALLFSLAIAVGLTPETLPMIITLSLSRGAIRMSKKKVIIKHLESIQNFGAMDILCTDKTGTLTMDKIVLQEYGDFFGNEDNGVLYYAFVNSSLQTGIKNVLDKAILRNEHINIRHLKKKDEIPFDFNRKIVSVVVQSDRITTLVSKGAVESILERCSRYEINGALHKITKSVLEKSTTKCIKLSEQGFRVILVAYKNITKEKDSYSKEDECDLILKGYLAFLDPEKPTTKKALKCLQDLGIEIKILTGDNEVVTKKICNDVALNIKGILTGNEIDKLNSDRLKVAVENTTIFAKLTPIQKERIIATLHENKHTVGYLGDGINDALSLKTADVGISVNNAVSVAKESANIILLEKDLMVLPDGVIEGRKTFSNILKYTRMSASSNFGNMISMTLATLFVPFLPMLPVQLLLNNFLYDASQIALPSDNVDEETIRKPRQWHINNLRKFMINIGSISSIFDLATFGILLLVFKATEGFFQTGWFIESILTQILIIHVLRTNKIPFIQSKPSKFLIINSVIILAIVIFFVTNSVLANIFGFEKMPLSYFVFLTGILILYAISVHWAKMLFVKKFGDEL